MNVEYSERFGRSRSFRIVCLVSQSRLSSCRSCSWLVSQSSGRMAIKWLLLVDHTTHFLLKTHPSSKNTLKFLLEALATCILLSACLARGGGVFCHQHRVVVTVARWH